MIYTRLWLIYLQGYKLHYSYKKIDEFGPASHFAWPLSLQNYVPCKAQGIFERLFLVEHGSPADGTVAK